MKVMLIEDDITMVSLLSMLLEIEGFGVVKMPEPESGKIIAALKNEMPSLVLMDVNLAHLNGLDLLRQIREDQNLKDIRILMASGLDYRRECLQAGADDFILKPYMPDDLISQMRRLLNSAR